MPRKDLITLKIKKKLRKSSFFLHIVNYKVKKIISSTNFDKQKDNNMLLSFMNYPKVINLIVRKEVLNNEVSHN